MISTVERYWRKRSPASYTLQSQETCNVFVKRLWNSVKYEEVYLKAYESVGEARASLGKYLEFYTRNDRGICQPIIDAAAKAEVLRYSSFLS